MPAVEKVRIKIHTAPVFLDRAIQIAPTARSSVRVIKDFIK
jgi:hypothetical protein